MTLPCATFKYQVAPDVMVLPDILANDFKERHDGQLNSQKKLVKRDIPRTCYVNLSHEQSDTVSGWVNKQGELEVTDEEPLSAEVSQIKHSMKNDINIFKDDNYHLVLDQLVTNIAKHMANADEDVGTKTTLLAQSAHIIMPLHFKTIKFSI
jgi:hypothetical protein